MAMVLLFHQVILITCSWSYQNYVDSKEIENIRNEAAVLILMYSNCLSISFACKLKLLYLLVTAFCVF